MTTIIPTYLFFLLPLTLFCTLISSFYFYREKIYKKRTGDIHSIPNDSCSYFNSIVCQVLNEFVILCSLKLKNTQDCHIFLSTALRIKISMIIFIIPPFNMGKQYYTFNPFIILIVTWRVLVLIVNDYYGTNFTTYRVWGTRLTNNEQPYLSQNTKQKIFTYIHTCKLDPLQKFFIAE